MSRSLLTITGALCVLVGTAQSNQLPADEVVDLNSGWGHVIAISGTAGYNSNTVFNELPLAIYSGEELSRPLRERSLNKLTADRNRAGYSVTGRVSWSGPACLKKLPNWRPVISVAYHELGGTRFTKDQFALTFFGNAEYENRTANLAPSGYQQVRYQTLGAGIQHQGSGSLVRMDLVRGQSFSEADIRSATLFTAPDGRELRTEVVGNYYASDTAGSGFDRTNGVGIAVTGRWKAQFQMGSKRIDVGLGLDDLGFLAWNSNTVSIRKDTLITYNGWQVDNIFALDEVLIGEDVLLDTLGLRFRTGSVTRALPFLASLELGTNLGTYGHIGIHIDQRYMVGYVPHIALQASRRVGTRTQLGISAGYGGFGGARLGIAVKRRIGKHMLVQVASPHVPGFITGSTRGAGVSFGLEFAF